MNFTYVFEDDPTKDQLQGNLTWIIPNLNVPAHWIHTEDICKFYMYLEIVFFFFWILFIEKCWNLTKFVLI